MTRQVQLSDEAYERLRAEKRDGESFSDVVLRLTGKKSLASFRTGRSKKEIRAHQAMLREMAELDRADMERWMRRRRRLGRVRG